MAKQTEAVEIEKKWLVPYKAHSDSILAKMRDRASVGLLDIQQYYTPNGRVRRSVDINGQVDYEAIRKRPREGGGSIEEQMPGVPEDLFRAAEADPSNKKILKTRFHCELTMGACRPKVMLDFLRSDTTFAPFGAPGLIILEIELDEEHASEENFQRALRQIVGGETVIDVTENKSFTNKSLSL